MKGVRGQRNNLSMWDCATIFTISISDKSYLNISQKNSNHSQKLKAMAMAIVSIHSFQKSENY